MLANPEALGLLSAMITPAVLISACGTLIFSTSTRLARVVDRVRQLSRQMEQDYTAAEETPFVDERRIEVERQILLQARRGRLIQRSLTSLYVALGFFVGATVSIGVSVLIPRVPWLPALLGVTGTLVLFYGCMLFIGETRLALRSVDLEMEFALSLRALYEERHGRGRPQPPQG